MYNFDGLVWLGFEELITLNNWTEPEKRKPDIFIESYNIVIYSKIFQLATICKYDQ